MFGFCAPAVKIHRDAVMREMYASKFADLVRMADASMSGAVGNRSRLSRRCVFHGLPMTDLMSLFVAQHFRPKSAAWRPEPLYAATKFM
jgi:hypothetical protein